MSRTKHPYHDDSMFKGAPPEIFRNAKILRSKLTKTELIMWDVLNNGLFKKYKFRRQHPIHIYIADFYCHKLKLIIEIDGDYHKQVEQKEKDQERTTILNFQDITVIRFTNKQVLEELSQVEKTIMDYIQNFENNSSLV